MKKEFIVNRQGKDFVLYTGLLDQAHREGLKRITTTLIQAPSDENGHLAICHAEVETEKGVFAGIGDASPQNVGRMIAAHTVRMAETRAKARALRDAINVGVTAVEELADVEELDEPLFGQAQPRPMQPVRKIAAVPHAEPAALHEAPAQMASTPQREAQVPQGTGPATAQQLDRLSKLHAALGRPFEVQAGLSFEAAAGQIAELVRIFNSQARGTRRSQA